MAPYFFRVEHDLLRSEAFKTLGGSAIKVYLVIGLYSDFGTGLGVSEHPDDRPPGRVEPTDGPGRDRGADAVGPAGDQQVEGTVDAYRIIRQARPSGRRATEEGKAGPESDCPGPDSLEGPLGNWSKFFRGSLPDWSKFFEDAGPVPRPGQAPRLGPNENQKREKTRNSIPIPGTPFRLTAEGGCLLLWICRNC